MRNIPQAVDMDELHVASLIALVRPENLEAVRERISAIKDVEIFADDPSGKLILVAEAKNSKRLSALTSEVETTQGVMSASLVYHETLNADEAKSPAHVDNDKETTLEKIKNAQANH